MPIVRDYTSGGPQVHASPQSVIPRCGTSPCHPAVPPPCTLNYTELATSPADQQRTTIGVGEVVELSGNGGGWFVTGDDGALSSTVPGPTVFYAGAVAGEVTVTEDSNLDYDEECNERSVSFTVIAPSGLVYEQVNGLKHTQGLDDIGMETYYYLQPDTVSFTNVEFQEVQAYAQVAAPEPAAWSCQANNPHLPAPTPTPLAVLPESGTLGSQVNTTDIAYSAGCTFTSNGQPVAPTAGYEEFQIPDEYVVVSDPTGTWYPITTTTQEATLTSAGALSMYKGGVTSEPSITINSPTSCYTSFPC